MLISEIVNSKKIDLETIQKRESLPFNMFSTARLGPPIGSGQFAKIYKGKDINEVIKIARISGLTDPFVKFIRTVVENQDNHFFPRIYSANIYEPQTDITPGLSLVIEMEKLIPLTDKIIRRAGKGLLNQAGFDIDDETEYKNIRDIIVQSTFSPKVRKKVLKKSTNPQFKEAMKAIEQIMVIHHSDLNDNNMMVRLTGHGPQLVITDPVY